MVSIQKIMMNNKEASIKNFTRGGQIILHNTRMLVQIMSWVTLSSFFIFILSTFIVTYIQLSNYERSLVIEWGKAEVYVKMFGEKSTQNAQLPNGEKKLLNSYQIIQSRQVNLSLNKAIHSLIYAFFIGLIISGLSFMLTYRYLRKQGEAQSEAKKIRGDELVPINTIKKLILQSGKVSDINIADLPMPNNFECRHILVHGTIGTGKSELIKRLLDQIRKRGDRAIIYDKGCDYIRYFFREDKDFILNALDDRGKPWHLWNECRDFADYDSLAAALIPHASSGGDPFWVNAARAIFSASARQMAQDKDRSIVRLLETLLTSDLDYIETFLKGTEAESLVSKKIEKTAITIKSVLAASLKSLKYIKDDKSGFSIRNWISDEDQSSWLFVSSLSDRHETIKPLITMWLDIAVNALMSLEPSQDRRIWLILDELPTLNKLPYLISTLAESRKFGGCLLVGVQSISQLREIYGVNGAEGISGLCNTKFFFRSPSFDTALWVSKELGQKDIEEVKEGISYSESAMRSGISISKHESSKQIVSPSEIMCLKELSTFVRIIGYPITEISFPYQNRDKIAASFIMRNVTDGNFYLTHKNDRCNNEKSIFTNSIDMSKNDEVNLDW